MSKSNSKCSLQRLVPDCLNTQTGITDYANLHLPIISKGTEDPLNLRMFVGTWNVGGKSPNQDDKGLNLKEWLIHSHSQPDIYVIGFQEIVPLNAGNVLGWCESGPAAKWVSLITQVLNDQSDEETVTLIDSKPRMSFSELLLLEDEYSEEREYKVVATKQMVGILLCVWVRSNLCKSITNLNVCCVGTGVMGYLGNKGSISMSMTLKESSFCFVCTHLSSGEKQGDELRRNLDVSEILKKTTFFGQPRTIMDHHKVIWLGDLNYRLANIQGIDYTHELIKNQDWKTLLQKDQLRIEQRSGRVFQGWEEGNIEFAPTYKYLPNSNHYYISLNSKSTHKQRTPAWCDRILWKGEGIKQEWYERGDSNFSDHRPVSSLFQFHIQSYNVHSHKHKHKSNNTMPLLLGLAKVQAEELLPLFNIRRNK